MADKKWKVFFLFSLLLLLSLLLLIHFHYAFFSLLFLQRPLLINYNAGILMTNGMLWNIHKIARYGDTYMILDRHKLKFSGNLLIEKVNVSVAIFHCLHFVLFCSDFASSLNWTSAYECAFDFFSLLVYGPWGGSKCVKTI